MKIMVLNSGSSSQKSCLYEIGSEIPLHPPAPLWEGQIGWEGTEAEIRIKNAQGAQRNERVLVDSRAHAIARLLDTAWQGPLRVLSTVSEIGAAGHRIVHGGRDLVTPTLVTPAVKKQIEHMSVFAPLHNRAELEGIDIVQRQVGEIPQVAVFDTGFHSGMPEASTVYPGPYEWLAQGIRRYGFHGINHQYCAERAAQLLGAELSSLKIVTCHLGNGCSLAAIHKGKSVDTTMGFTPLEGLMMGTRSGSVDPGILTFLMRQESSSPEMLDEVLNTRSGLLGISGLSSDMRQIVTAMKAGSTRAKLAFEIFVHRLQTGIGAMLAALDGMDVLVFTAGIGENSPEIRAAACSNFSFLGLQLNEEKNNEPAADRQISQPDSRVRVLTIRAQEDWAIARECWRLLRK